MPGWVQRWQCRRCHDRIDQRFVFIVSKDMRGTILKPRGDDIESHTCCKVIKVGEMCQPQIRSYKIVEARIRIETRFADAQSPEGRPTRPRIDFVLGRMLPELGELSRTLNRGIRCQ